MLTTIILSGLVLYFILYVTAFDKNKKNDKPLNNKTKKMNKALILTGIVLLVLVGLSVWSSQYRSFYCISAEKCVTVWKRSDDKCYVIPGKYYGVFTPSSNYIETTNRQYLTIYFSDDLPNTIIVRSQGSSTGEKGGYEIVNNLPGDRDIVKYSDNYRSILYKEDATKFKDVKATTEYIDLDIKENYAIDKTGKKLK